MVYTVKLIGSDHICRTKEDALELYRAWASWNTDIALESWNTRTGRVTLIRKKGTYFN